MATTVEPETRPEMVRRIDGESVPPEVAALVEEYGEVARDRDELLWKWLWHVFPRFRLSSVPERHAGAARRAKFCFSLYMTVLDDLSERHRDRATFEAGRRIPVDGPVSPASRPGVDAAAVDLLNRAWAETERHLEGAPRGDRFRELFEFDVRQSLNTMDYNRLVNESPRLATPAGVDRYDTHNMLLFPYVDVDLAFSPAFDAADLAALRDLVWEAQKLVRIGNWVTTWERELREGDYTSKVVVEALDRGVIDPDELDTVPAEALVRRIRDSPIQRELLLDWNDIYGRLRRTDHGLSSVDADAFVDGVRYLLEVDVKMRGFK